MNLRHPSLALAALLAGATLLGGCTAAGGAKSRTATLTPTPVVAAETSATQLPAEETPAEALPSEATPSEALPSETPAEAEPSEATPSEAQPSEPMASATPSVTLGQPAPAPSDAASPALGGPSPAAGASAAPISTASAAPGLVTAPAGTVTPLSLGSAFHNEGWTTGLYQAPGTAAQAPAFAATVNCGGDPVWLEYRFAPTTGTLTLKVAQDVLSTSAENTINVQALADGKSVAEKSVSFKQSGTLQVPLTGVTVVKIQAAPKGSCSTSSTVLITQATVQG